MTPERTDAERIADLVRILAKVAAGDYSEKPQIIEAMDEIAKFTLAVRFMIDDLEMSRATEAKRSAALEAANAQLRELSDLKTRFLNSAAHELNTPLTPLRVQLHLLRSARLGPLNDAQSRATEMLERNIERLSLLVGDLLDASRLQSDKLRLERNVMRLDALVLEATQSFAAQADAAGVALEVRPSPEVAVHADPRRVTQVVFNLVSNALKFTPRGGAVRVGVDVFPAEALVRVEDTGPGMVREQLDRLFRPFSQVHDVMHASVGGTGLGLYISRGIVEQHGGRMWCESDGPGRGSAFLFSLPLAGPGAVATPYVVGPAQRIGK